MKNKIVIWKYDWVPTLIIIILIFSLVFIFLRSEKSRNKLPNELNTKKTKSKNTETLKSTQTIHQCKIINLKNQEDIDRERAEQNLSSYSYKVLYDHNPNNKVPALKTITVKILEKKLLPCNRYNENYCQISNDTLWTIAYPVEWKLYRIKRRIEPDTYEINYYDLKFEHQSSYFYLKETITLGGSPLIIPYQAWLNLSKNCNDRFFIDSNNEESYICYGNLINCAAKIEGDSVGSLNINTFYKSIISVNSSIQNNETLIYGWYIPSINFEKENKALGSRVYSLSEDFYSNDEKFISELKKIYLQLKNRSRT